MPTCLWCRAGFQTTWPAPTFATVPTRASDRSAATRSPSTVTPWSTGSGSTTVPPATATGSCAARHWRPRRRQGGPSGPACTAVSVPTPVRWGRSWPAVIVHAPVRARCLPRRHLPGPGRQRPCVFAHAQPGHHRSSQLRGWRPPRELPPIPRSIPSPGSCRFSLQPGRAVPHLVDGDRRGRGPTGISDRPRRPVHDS